MLTVVSNNFQGFSRLSLTSHQVFASLANSTFAAYNEVKG
jgi:hypothetical protein